MVSSYAPSLYSTDVVTGQAITNLLATILQQAAQNQNALYQTSGYYDPYSLGSSTLMPTLQRELGMGNLALGQGGLELDRELGFGDLGLRTDALNYQQRAGEKGFQLDALNTLMNQRGPENYLAYNYGLNALGTPEGMPADIREFTKGLVQPSSFNMPEQSVSHQRSPDIMSNSGGGGSSQRKGGNMLVQTGRTPKGQKVGTSYTTLDDGSALVVDQNRLDSDPNYLNLLRQSVESGQRAPGLAAGGQTNAPLVQVGDSPAGPTGAEEVVANPTGAPIAVLPNEALGGMDPQQAAAPGPEEILQMIFALLQSAMPEMGQQGQPGGAPQGPMAAAEGGMFGGTVYSPDTIAAAPALQKIRGERPSREFGGTAFDMTLPETDTKMPGLLNLRDFQTLAPSERAFTQGVYETPRRMGGLGLDFNDILAMSAAAAPTGQRFAPATYG